MAERVPRPSRLLNWPLDHHYSPVPDNARLYEEPTRGRVWPEQPQPTPGIDWRGAEQVRLVSETLQPFAEFPVPIASARARHEYRPDNGQFHYLDAWLLQAMLRHARPRRVIEVGCGWSSLVTAWVNRGHLGGGATVTCIDPAPAGFLAAGVPGIADVIQSRVEDLPLQTFAALEGGDVLFVDTTHVVKTGGDVVFLLNEELPRLAPGVLVHVHDIWLPRDYPASWVMAGWSWNENYAVRAFLSFNWAFDVLAGVSWLRLHRPYVLESCVPRIGELENGLSASLWIRRGSRKRLDVGD